MATKVRRKTEKKRRSARRLDEMARKFREAVAYCRDNRGDMTIQKCVSKYLKGEIGKTKRRAGEEGEPEKTRRARRRTKSRRRC